MSLRRPVLKWDTVQKVSNIMKSKFGLFLHNINYSRYLKYANPAFIRVVLEPLKGAKRTCVCEANCRKICAGQSQVTFMKRTRFYQSHIRKLFCTCWNDQRKKTKTWGVRREISPVYYLALCGDTLWSTQCSLCFTEGRISGRALRCKTTKKRKI